MDRYTATEQAFKHGYEKGYEAGQSDVAAECQLCAKATKEVIESLQRKFATENNVGCKWIPVSDPPKEKGCYLTAVKHWFDGKPVTREAFWNSVDWLTCEDKYEITPRVTHWMPLPEPPKEGE